MIGWRIFWLIISYLIVDLFNVFQRWLAAEHEEGKGARPQAKAQVSIRNSCDVYYTWYLLILMINLNMLIEKELIAYHARFWGDYWSVLKWHDCIGSKSLLVTHENGISLYFFLNMVRTHVQLSMSSQWWNLKYIFHVQYNRFCCWTLAPLQCSQVARRLWKIARLTPYFCDFARPFVILGTFRAIKLCGKQVNNALKVY